MKPPLFLIMSEENPKKIRGQIKRKIGINKFREIPSRDLAIKKAIMDLKSGDILIEYDQTSKGFQFSPLTIVYD